MPKTVGLFLSFFHTPLSPNQQIIPPLEDIWKFISHHPHCHYLGPSYHELQPRLVYLLPCSPTILPIGGPFHCGSKSHQFSSDLSVSFLSQSVCKLKSSSWPVRPSSFLLPTSLNISLPTLHLVHYEPSTPAQPLHSWNTPSAPHLTAFAPAFSSVWTYSPYIAK